MPRMGACRRRLGVIGSMVWDTIHGRDAARRREEWGGIAYALAALDAALPDYWQIVSAHQVVRDLVGAPQANRCLSGLRRTVARARFIEVPEPNNRVHAPLESSERRCENAGRRAAVDRARLGRWSRISTRCTSTSYLLRVRPRDGALLRRASREFIYADLHACSRQERIAPGCSAVAAGAGLVFGCFDLFSS